MTKHIYVTFQSQVSRAVTQNLLVWPLLDGIFWGRSPMHGYNHAVQESCSFKCKQAPLAHRMWKHICIHTVLMVFVLYLFLIVGPGTGMA